MAWIATDKDGRINIFPSKPYRNEKHLIWNSDNFQDPLGDYEPISIDTCKLLLGYTPIWEDEPVELITKDKIYSVIILYTKPTGGTDIMDIQSFDNNENAHFYMIKEFSKIITDENFQNFIKNEHLIINTYRNAIIIKNPENEFCISLGIHMNKIYQNKD